MTDTLWISPEALARYAERLDTFTNASGVGWHAETCTFGLYGPAGEPIEWLTFGYPTVGDAARERNRDAIRHVFGATLPIDARERSSGGG